MLDTLGGMYVADSVQLSRIKSIEKLLVQRDKQLSATLKRGLVNNKSFTQEVQKLNELVNKDSSSKTPLSQQKKTSTITILPVDESNNAKILQPPV
ncbi:hypothetical protein CS542_03095 [Pedobacter sp. IW39]|nr:hypothetical protein CS542_03095 [Pedobacter sp. IW39]